MDEPVPSTSNSDDPPFNFLAVGNEPEKLKYVVLQHVKNSSFRKLFGPLSVDNQYMDEVTCAEACTILKALESSEALENCCYAMASLLTTEKKCLLSLDRIITKIIFTAYEEGIIPLLLACQLLVTSVDFKSSIPLNPEKIRFVRERMHQLDYKNMRDLLKLLLVEKLDKMQCVLSEYQHQQLMPVEELMIDLIDRKKNFCPALFFITEISRIAANSSVHFLPRVSLKIREMVASFRPLAEIGSMIGRSWLYPITTQALFSWSWNTWSTWKLQETTYRLYFKTHLPYSSENMAPQTYFQYILLKQPRGQENLCHMLRSSSSHSGTSSRIQCNEVIQILLLEAMGAMEESELGISTPMNQYNWIHLSHLVTYALFIGCCSLQSLLSLLQTQLKNCHYNKAKGELMWIVLQYVALTKPKVNATGASTKNQLDGKNRDLILEIFNTLYPHEMVWAGCSTDTLNMVRFFTPAAIWMNLSHYPANTPMAIPPKVQQHIDFLQTQLDSRQLPENGVLAVIANGYSNNPEAFETHVSRAVLKMLGANIDQPQPSPAPMAMQHTLPHGRKAEGCVCALDLSLLDSLTFHAKRMLYQNLTNYLQICTQNGRLPSPALLETIARLLLTTEMFVSNWSIFSNLFSNIIRAEPKNVDLIAIFADLLNYRLQSAQLNPPIRAQLISCAFEALCGQASSSESQAVAIHTVCEQIIMRQTMLASPLDFISMAFILISNVQSKNLPHANLFTHPEAFDRADYMHESHACPEIHRMILLNLCRAHKMIASTSNHIASEYNTDFTQLLRPTKWPASAVKWFPIALQNAVDVDPGPDPSYIDNLNNMSEQEHQAFLQGSDVCFSTQFKNSRTIMISIFRCIYEYSNFPTISYKILAQLSANELILNTNYFVDYIISKSGTLHDMEDEQGIDRLLNVVNEMVFVHHCIPIERFLLSIVLHPNDDRSIEMALFLLSGMIRKSPNFTQGIHMYCNSSNAMNTKSEDLFTKLADYYKKYPEYTYSELYKRSVREMPEKFSEPMERRLPIYYDSMPERILPIVDILLQRSLEIAINPEYLTLFLNAFSPIYKLHPQPITFLYKTMYSLDSLNTFSHTTPARKFVVDIVQKVDDERSPKYCVVTHEFIANGHKAPIVEVCQQLVDRIIAGSTYMHQPPSFAFKDWRFAEYPPAAQALTGAWIELMASPYSAAQVTEGIVQLAMTRPITRPYDTMNALGLLLTGLPSSFQTVFFDKIVESFEWSQVENGQPSMFFESFSQEVYLYSESRVLSMLALIHSFCQHAGNRISDKEKLRHMNEYLKVVISIYDVLGKLVEKIGPLNYEDTVCDLLYQLKYMFVGYSLKNEVEQAIEKFPRSMREKLKFLLTHSSTAENIQQQQQQHAQQALSQQSQHPQSFASSQPNIHLLQQMLHPAAVGYGPGMGPAPTRPGVMAAQQQISNEPHHNLNGPMGGSISYEGQVNPGLMHQPPSITIPPNVPGRLPSMGSNNTTPGSQPGSVSNANPMASQVHSTVPPPPPYTQSQMPGMHPGMGNMFPSSMSGVNPIVTSGIGSSQGPIGSMASSMMHNAGGFPGMGTGPMHPHSVSALRPTGHHMNPGQSIPGSGPGPNFMPGPGPGGQFMSGPPPFPVTTMGMHPGPMMHHPSQQIGSHDGSHQAAMAAAFQEQQMRHQQQMANMKQMGHNGSMDGGQGNFGGMGMHHPGHSM
ncbi:mediator complex subunit 23 domain-containing protein [Ditylenchus destructor]|uniref:Mediator of RNA polymerase II transcription subunit 23 n=1 Tax=Ditylenchus destructor TaxID=166010 RepID=A0AAD4NG07_9BILA|nr:mediator complex subunit 23 domain-containing protein [Ditylenchus destructor]